jgi:hypothetical protein
MCAANRAKVAKYAASLETHPSFRQPVFFRISVLLVPAASQRWHSPSFNLRPAPVNTLRSAPPDRPSAAPLSFRCPPGQSFKIKHIAPYWAPLPIAPASPNPHNLFHPERGVFLSGTVQQNL